MSHVLAEILNHPAQVLFVVVLLGLFFLKYQGLTYQQFITTTNTIGTQPFALVVLIIGFWMLVCCKTYGIDTTIAGGVIGVASNMLQSQIKDAAHLTPGEIPPGSTIKSEQNTTVTAPKASETPEVPPHA